MEVGLNGLSGLCVLCLAMVAVGIVTASVRIQLQSKAEKIVTEVWRKTKHATPRHVRVRTYTFSGSRTHAPKPVSLTHPLSPLSSNERTEDIGNATCLQRMSIIIM